MMALRENLCTYGGVQEADICEREVWLILRHDRTFVSAVPGTTLTDSWYGMCFR